MLVRVGRISDAPVIFVAGHGWDQQIGRALRAWRLRLHCQAIHVDGVAGENQPGPEEEIGSRLGARVRGLSAWRPGHRLRRPRGERRRPPGPSDRDRVQTAHRALHGCRAGAAPRAPVEKGLGTAALQRLAHRAHVRQGSCGTSWGTMPRGPPTSSPNSGWATAWPGHRRPRVLERGAVTVRIVTDSTSDIDDGTARELGTRRRSPERHLRRPLIRGQRHHHAGRVLKVAVQRLHAAQNIAGVAWPFQGSV